MSATLTTDQFLDVLRKSKLVDDKRLEAFLQSLLGDCSDNLSRVRPTDSSATAC